MRKTLTLIAIIAATSAAATPEVTRHYGPAYAPDQAAQHLLIRGTTDIELFDPILKIFSTLNPNLAIVYEQWASNQLYDYAVAACVDQVEAADILISSSVDQQVKLVNDGCAQSHASAATQSLPQGMNWRDELFGITREPAVIVYNRALVPVQDIPLSRFRLIDLLRGSDGRYDGKVATYDIERSGLGYMFAFADSLQATTFGSLLEAFARGQAVITCCSAEIIDDVATGKYLIAYNILGSYALARAAHDPNIGIVAPSDYTLILSRGALIPKKAKNPKSAGDLIDFLVSDAGKNALSAQQLYLSPAMMREKGLMADEDGGSNLLVIPLSPITLVGLDRQRQLHFIERWQSAFSLPLPTTP